LIENSNGLNPIPTRTISAFGLVISIACLRAGIETVIIPWKNQKDVLEIPAHYRKKINFIPVKNIQEVLAIALVDYKGQLDLDQSKRKTEEPQKPKKDPQIAA
jgi:ATP-dependent Lon protease